MKKSAVVSALNSNASMRSPCVEIAPCPVTRGTILALRSDGLISVACHGDVAVDCEVIDTLANAALGPGDAVVLAMPVEQGGVGVVLGKVTRHRAEPAPTEVVIRATESLSLQCGASSIDLRADGKVMIRGEDVLVRAKGTQRIRAGTVSIN
jgi:hypothetical protein